MSEDLNSRETLERLVERLDRLEALLQANTARLHAVERRVGIEPATPARARRTPAEPDAAAGTAAPPTAFQPRATGAFGADATQATPPMAPATDATRARPAARRRDIESLVGGSWFNWIGIIAVTFGVAFFLKLAFDNEWIGPGARVALGALAGLALLYAGERLRARGLRHYAFVISGGGVLILYLSVYAAYNFYRLVPQPAAFLLMAAVTAAAVLLAVRLDALAVAVLGLAGGFLTPALLSTGVDNEVALFTYVALLDAGVLAVAYFKRWRGLDFLSFAGTVLTTFGWAINFYGNGKLWTTIAFLTVFFVLYSLLAVFHNVLPRRPSRWFDVALASANAAFYFGLSYLFLSDAGYDRATPASLSLLVSAFFAGLFYAAFRLSREDRLLAYGYVAASATFFTVAVAIQLELQWVTVAWAVEGLTLTWAGLRSGESAARHSALAVYGVAALHWLAFDAREFSFAGGVFVPLFNTRALPCAVLVAALACGVWLYRRGGERITERERTLAAALCLLAANALALVLLSLDLSYYFERQKAAASSASPGARARDLELAKQLSLSIVWALYGGCLLVAGRARRLRLLRLMALALLSLTTLKVFFWDLSSLDRVYRIVSFIVLGAILLAVSYLYQKSQQRASEEEAATPAPDTTEAAG